MKILQDLVPGCDKVATNIIIPYYGAQVYVTVLYVVTLQKLFHFTTYFMTLVFSLC